MYKTIEECTKELEDVSVNMDTNYTAMMCLYDAAAIFIYTINIFIVAVLIGLSIMDFITGGMAIWIYCSYFVMIITEKIMSKAIRKEISRKFANIKYDIALQYFEKYERYNELKDWEKSQIFENKITNAIGLIKVD